jgi:hypothetical protein
MSQQDSVVHTSGEREDLVFFQLEIPNRNIGEQLG